MNYKKIYVGDEMGKYFAKRLGMAIVTIFLVTCLTFLLMNAVPGSPWLSEKSPTEATLAALNAKYGLDKPVYVQLIKYLGNLAHGDFGVSLKMQKNRPVLSIILEMFPVSAKIGAIALAWAVLVGVPLGCLAAFKRGKLTDSILRVVCTLGISMPSFVVASVLLVTLAGGISGFKLFPTIFDASAGWRTYVLPCFSLGFYPMCWSRVYLGVHYFGDVLCGMIVGLINASIVYYLFQRYLRKYAQPFRPKENPCRLYTPAVVCGMETLCMLIIALFTRFSF